MTSIYGARYFGIVDQLMEWLMEKNPRLGSAGVGPGVCDASQVSHAETECGDRSQAEELRIDGGMAEKRQQDLPEATAASEVHDTYGFPDCPWSRAGGQAEGEDRDQWQQAVGNQGGEGHSG